MGHGLWMPLSSNEVYNNQRGLVGQCEEVCLPDGRVLSDYYQVELPNHVTVYALTLDGRVACLRQYKYGPRKVALTLPGGLLDGSEEPLNAAKHELLEETGLVSEIWTSLGSFTIGGNQGIGTAHLFVASGAKDLQTSASGDLEEMHLEYLTPERGLAF